MMQIDNYITISPAKNGFSLSYNGKVLLSAFDPVKQAERAADCALPLQNRTLYLIPAPLFGYGVKTIVDALPEDSAVLCIEADKNLCQWTKNNFDKSILIDTAAAAANDNVDNVDNIENINSIENIDTTSHKKLKLIYTCDPLEVCDFVRKTWGQCCFRRVISVKLNAAWQVAAKIYEQIEATLQKSIAIDWSNAATLSKLGRLYARNAVKNLKLLYTAGNINKIDLSGKNVLVFGAGPSLDDALNKLSGVIKKVIKKGFPSQFVICVDTALGALVDRGIRPDLVVILEAQHWNLRDFIGWKGMCCAKGIPAAMDISSLPRSAGILESDTYIFWTEWTQLRFLDRLKNAALLPLELPALGSVGLSAVMLACKLNAKKILAAGLDFSFTIDKYHCKGSPSYRSALNTANRLKSPLCPPEAMRAGSFNCLSKSGLPVRSDPALRNYQKLFAETFGKGNCNYKSQIFDIEGSGMDLGLQTLSYAQAITFLNESGTSTASQVLNSNTEELDVIQKRKAAVEMIIEQEKNNLSELLNILQGNKAPDNLDHLLEECDYLWAHFPDCAGRAGKRPPSTDIAFLKRVRAEIEPFSALFNIT
ncbi:MAG: DUF115 domain-containing protein [Termitinemataceae bacterium]|nr:MAG: DUF115 domain-containing protein [Termitinemataceae bacterium]